MFYSIAIWYVEVDCLVQQIRRKMVMTLFDFISSYYTLQCYSIKTPASPNCTQQIWVGWKISLLHLFYWDFSRMKCVGREISYLIPAKEKQRRNWVIKCFFFSTLSFDWNVYYTNFPLQFCFPILLSRDNTSETFVSFESFPRYAIQEICVLQRHFFSLNIYIKFIFDFEHPRNTF